MRSSCTGSVVFSHAKTKIPSPPLSSEPIHTMLVKRRSFSNAWDLFDEMCGKRIGIVSRKKTVPCFADHTFSTPPGGGKVAELCCSTFFRLLGNCVRLNDISTGRRVHSQIIKSGFCLNSFVVTALTDMYSKCGFVQDAHMVFDGISSRDLVTWNVLVSCYAMNGREKQAFEVFEMMRLEGFVGDGFTYSGLLNSCSSLGCCELGNQTHGLVIKLSLDSDVVVGSALVDMYAKCGDIEYARRCFDFMEIRNVVSWNAIIVGYGQTDKGKEPVMLLRRMLGGGWKPDELTLASVLSSSANLAAGNEANQVHNYVMKTGFQSFTSVANALITAYAKSGDIHSAFRSFYLISQPDLVTWSSMVSSYAFHGHVNEAIDMFERMLHEGVRPDGIAFMGVLSACSHAGLVEAGLQYFRSMRRDYCIETVHEHYACFVDLLARSGYLSEAYNVISDMPLEPGGDVLGTFIGACKVHGNTVLAKWAADKLFRLEPAEPVNYMLMSNIYAALGCWDGVARMREMMKKRCGNKVPGCSWTEIGGRVHTFVSKDRQHPEAPHVYFTLGLLIKLMKEDGCMSDAMLTSDEFGN